MLENKKDRKVHPKYYLPKLEIKDYNVVIDAESFFDQPVKSGRRRYDTIRKIALQIKEMITQLVFGGTIIISKIFYKMIAIDLSKQQALDADRKAIQLINFTANLDHDNGATTLFIIEEAKETILDISQGTLK